MRWAYFVIIACLLLSQLCMGEENGNASTVEVEWVMDREWQAVQGCNQKGSRNPEGQGKEIERRGNQVTGSGYKVDFMGFDKK